MGEPPLKAALIGLVKALPALVFWKALRVVMMRLDSVGYRLAKRLDRWSLDLCARNYTRVDIAAYDLSFYWDELTASKLNPKNWSIR